GSPFSCSTSPASWPMLSPSSPSCWQSKHFWCSRLNDMSPAGARGRLDVNIKQKSFRAASGGKLHVLGELVFSLRSGEVATLVGPSGWGKTTLVRIVAGLDRDFDGQVAFPADGRLRTEEVANSADGFPDLVGDAGDRRRPAVYREGNRRVHRRRCRHR